MAISPRYFFTVQHPRFLSNARVEPRGATVVMARPGDNAFGVMHFTGVDGINDGFSLEIHIKVTDSLIAYLFSGLIDNFLEFIIKEQPSLLFTIQAPNEAESLLFNAFYEGVAVSARIESHVPASAAGSDDGYYQIGLVMVSRLQAMDASPHTYVYENTDQNISIRDPREQTTTVVDFTTSPTGTRGITLQEVLTKVLTAQKMTDKLDYVFRLNPQMVIDGTIQPNASFVNSGEGIGLAANYLLHSMDVDASSGLFRYTSRSNMRFQYEETDFNFVNRLCQAEGVSILYEVTQIVINSEAISVDTADSTKSVITTQYTITYANGTTATFSGTRRVPRATNDAPQFLTPNNTAIRRSVAVIADYDNYAIVQLSPATSAGGRVTINYPLVRKAPPASIATLGVRNIFAVSETNTMTPEAVVVANYSEQTNAIGSTIEHAPVNAVAWNARISSTGNGTRILTREPNQEVAYGTGVQYYYGETLISDADARRMAVRRMQMLKTQANAITASSLAVDMRAGCSFHILDQYYSSAHTETTKCYVFSVTLRGYNTEFYNRASGLTSPVSETYVNEFKYIQTDSIHNLVYRPTLTAPRPSIRNGIQAVVASEQIHDSDSYPDVDAYGRYLVHFIADRQQRDSRSYPRMRSAGARLRKAVFFADGLDRSGFHFPLHKDTRVLVAFHAQNPDMPVIVGVLPNEYLANRLRNMAISEQMSYLRSVASGIMFIDKEKNERVVVETDTEGALSATSALDNADFSGDNYLELGTQKIQDRSASDLHFGIRMGTTGFNQLTVAGGMQSTVMTASKYREITNRRNQEQANSLLADLNITTNTTINLDLNLEDLSNDAFAAELFSFRRYTIDAGGITDNLMPSTVLYRNEQYVASERVAILSKETTEGVAKEDEAKEATDNDSDAIETLAKRPEREASGSFYRIIGDEYVYRQGHDFECSYTGADNVIKGTTDYCFGNNIVDYYPSSASEWQTEQQLRTQDERAINKISGQSFSYDDYMSADNRDRPAIAARRYLGNYARLVEGSYSAQTMENSYLVAGSMRIICGLSFTGEVEGDIDITSNNTSLYVTPSGNISSLMVRWFTSDVAREVKFANEMHVTTNMLTRVGLGFDVKFSFNSNMLTAGVHSEANVLGEVRCWTGGMRTEVRGVEVRTALMVEEVKAVNWRTLGAEMLSGVILSATNLYATVNATISSMSAGIKTETAAVTKKGGVHIQM